MPTEQPKRNRDVEPEREFAVAIRLLQSLYWSYLAKPVADRAIYRLLRRSRLQRIVEIGVGDGQRSSRMIQLAQSRLPAGQVVHYTGIDLFESRPASEVGITLKGLHRQLAPLTAQVRLHPGDAFGALSRIANQLTQTDLLIIRAGQSDEVMQRAWHFVPRMLHAQSRVLVPGDGSGPDVPYRTLGLADVQRMTPSRIAA